MIAQEKRRSLKDLHRDRKECSTREKNVPFNSILSLSGPTEIQIKFERYFTMKSLILAQDER